MASPVMTAILRPLSRSQARRGLVGLAMTAACVMTACVSSRVAVVEEPSPAYVEPCPMPTDGSFGSWRLVRAERFTLCVPMEWKVTGSRLTHRTGSIQWRWGRYVPERVPFVVGQRSSVDAMAAPPGRSARGNRVLEEIDGQMVDLFWNATGARAATGAVWQTPEFHMLGEATSPEAAEAHWAIFRTLRFTPTQ